MLHYFRHRVAGSIEKMKSGFVAGTNKLRVAAAETLSQFDANGGGEGGRGCRKLRT